MVDDKVRVLALLVIDYSKDFLKERGAYVHSFSEAHKICMMA
jgi:hypothetical protein